jgi:hypothetical protein
MLPTSLQRVHGVHKLLAQVAYIFRNTADASAWMRGVVGSRWIRALQNILAVSICKLHPGVETSGFNLLSHQLE